MSSDSSKNAPPAENSYPVPPPQRTLSQQVVAGFLQWPPAVWVFHRTLKALFGLHIHGLEHLPSQRPLLLVSNHASHYDGLFLRVIGREVVGAPIVSVAWGGARLFPFARAAFEGRAFHVVVTDDSSGAPEPRASVLDQIIEHLRAGRSVAMNPESYRYDELAPFKPGAAFAAMEVGIPIVPITLRGTYSLWRDLPWPRRWWGRVSAQIHPPIYPSEYPELPRREAVGAMIVEARRRIASVLDYPDGGSAK